MPIAKTHAAAIAIAALAALAPLAVGLTAGRAEIAAERAASQREARAEIEVKAYSISESRSKMLMPALGDMPTAQDTSLTVTLLVRGEGAGEAHQWGDPKFTLAADDRGRRLRAAQLSGFGTRDGFTDIDREQMFFFFDTPPEDTLLLELPFQAPARDAGSLSIEGQLTLVSATTRDATFGDLASLKGKVLENALLDDAGITVKITEVDAGQGGGGGMMMGGPTVELEVKDANNKLAALDLVDRRGNDATNSTSSFGWGDTMTYTLSADSDLGGLRLKLDVITETREIQVPFDLKNIELP